MRKKYRRILIIIALLLLLIFGFVFVMKNFDNKKKQKIEVKVLDTISGYGYSIDDRDSDFYKSEFEVLKKILSEDKVDEEKYATQVARMFVIDLFSMQSKLQKNDVGGIEFVLISDKDNYANNVQYGYYDLMQDDSYGDRKQDLPMVKDMTTKNVEKTTYILLDEEVSAYEIELEWSYEKDYGDDNHAYVTVIKDGIHESVVSYKTEKEEYDE